MLVTYLLYITNHQIPEATPGQRNRVEKKGTIETGPCLRVTGGCSHVYQGWSPAARSLEHFKILNSLLLLAHFSQHGPVPSVCTAGRGLQDLLALGGSCCSSVFPQLRKPSVCCSPLLCCGMQLLRSWSPWQMKSQLPCLCEIYVECNHLWQI